MSQRSNSPTDNRPWLRDVHEERKQRSLQIGQATIDALVAERTPVTLKNIHERSKELDWEGKGIHPNTIKTNPTLYEYYKEHSKTYKQKHSKRRIVVPDVGDDTVFRRIKLERDLTNVRLQYRKMSKAELVERLIHAEQFIANNHKKWTAMQFEKFRK